MFDIASQLRRPTVVLVHGGFSDVSIWAAVCAALLARGFGVLASANPLRGLAEDAEYLESFVRRIESPVLLVGHGYGGAVASVAANRLPNVAGLVFIAAFAPEAGESILDLLSRFPATSLLQALQPVPVAGVSGVGTVDLLVLANLFPAVLAADLPGEEVAVLANSQRALAAAAMEEMATQAGWDHLPCWYLVATSDRALHPDAQRFMAIRTRARVLELESSHFAPRSHPAEVADFIREAADSIARYR